MTTIEYYNLLSVITLVMFVGLIILIIFLWFKMDIGHYIAVLTGSEARKSINKIKKDAESGIVQSDGRKRDNRATISWNTSGKLKTSGKMGSAGLKFDKNTIKEQAPIEPTLLLDQQALEATTILEQPASSDATMLLSPQPAADKITE